MSTPNADQDSILVRSAKAGDYEAFEQLVARHERRLYSLAMRILRQREDAENVVQTAFLSALEHLRDFREESSFATWITRIATHGAFNVLRKRKGLSTVPLETSERDGEHGEVPHPQLIADWRGDPARIVERKELHHILTKAIDALPEKHRLVFVLRDVERLSVAETAQVLGITEPNVKVRLLRARLALRERLTRVFADPSKTVSREHRHEGDEHGMTPAEEILRSYLER
jgi:RNA polymerase sigma-70 factor (ECF subfamily)